MRYWFFQIINIPVLIFELKIIKDIINYPHSISSFRKINYNIIIAKIPRVHGMFIRPYHLRPLVCIHRNPAAYCQPQRQKYRRFIFSSIPFHNVIHPFL